jgi:hypothetical protein
MPAAEPATIGQKLINYLTAHPRKTNFDIAKAIKAQPNSIAAMTSQMAATGKLKRIDTGVTRGQGPRFLYEIGDLDSKVKYKPKRKLDDEKRTQLALEIQAELDADSKAKEALAKARNGTHHPSMAEKLDEALNTPDEAAEARQAEARRIIEEREAAQEPEGGIFAAKEETEAAYAKLQPPVFPDPLASQTEAVERERIREEVRQELLIEMAALEMHAPPQERPPQPPPKPKPMPTPIEDSMALTVPQTGSEIVAEVVSLVPIYRMIDSIANTMAAEIMHRLNVQLTAQVADMSVRLKQQIEVDRPSPEAMAARIANASQPLKKRLPTVLIVGLLPGQAGMISQEFGDVFDLRFWKDEAMEMLKHNAKNADYLITFTSKISHSAEEMIKSLNLPIIRCSGGMSMLRTKLTDLFVKSSDEQAET